METAAARIDCPGALGLADDWLFWGDYLHEGVYRHEYAVLARAALPRFSPQRAEEWVSWISTGPDLPDEEIQRRAQFAPEADESLEAKVARYNDTWRLGISSAVGREHLPQQGVALLADLESAHGEYRHADFPAYHSSWVGEDSPVSADELANWSVEQLLDFLRNWSPPPRQFEGPEETYNGLATELRTAVR
ncbi:hypothetical protein ACI789_07705 [Geodermatophilus sp. SYSU D00965]